MMGTVSCPACVLPRSVELKAACGCRYNANDLVIVADSTNANRLQVCKAASGSSPSHAVGLVAGGLGAQLARLATAGVVTLQVLRTSLDEGQPSAGFIIVQVALVPSVFCNDRQVASNQAPHPAANGTASSSGSEDSDNSGALPGDPALRWYEQQQYAHDLEAVMGACVEDGWGELQQDTQAGSGQEGEASSSTSSKGVAAHGWQAALRGQWQKTEEGDVRSLVFSLVQPLGWGHLQAQPPGLRCQLYPYQQRALSWCLWREANALPEQDPDAPSTSSAAPTSTLPAPWLNASLAGQQLFWQQCTLKGGVRVFYSPTLGLLSRTCPPPAPQLLPGGILADEMGLGKTVEVIALILHNRPPTLQPTPLQGPRAKQQKQGRAGTLIVAPTTILQQWRSEILRHSDVLRVGVYRGMEALRKRGSCPEELQAKVAAEVAALSQYDVVLTTYDVLRRDVHYADLSARTTYNTRHPRRYPPPKSPLVQLRWHRLVLDEAQMVGVGMTAVAEMAAHLTASLRWCVTGTPIGAHGLEDVLALFRVLHYCPFSSPRVFRRLLERPWLHKDRAAAAAALWAALKPVMWRCSKAAAARDHQLPPRHLHVVRLQQTSAERVFYMRVVDHSRTARDSWAATALLDVDEGPTALRLEASDAEEGGEGVQGAQGAGGAAGAGVSGGGGAGASGSGRKRGPGDAGQEEEGGAEPSKRARTENGHAGLQGGASTSRQGATVVPAGGASTSQPAIRPPPPGRGGGRRKRQSKAQKAEVVAREQLLQLRKACVHPQLTSFWSSLNTHQADQVAGASSMAEIMTSLRYAAQRDVQNAERDLCAHLNALAACLLAALPAPPPADGHPEANGAGAAPDEASGASAKKGGSGGSRRKSTLLAQLAGSPRKKGKALPPDTPEGLLKEAREALEQSHAVGEGGIEALQEEPGVAEPATADIAGADATIRAWRFVQANTAEMLRGVYEQLGNSQKVTAMQRDLQDKVADMLEGAQSEVSKVQSKVEGLQRQVAALEAMLAGEWEGAAAEVGAGLQLEPAAKWVAGTLEAVEAAAVVERERIAAAEQAADGGVVALMGTEVVGVLDARARELQPVKATLEGLLGEQLVGQARARMQAASRALGSQVPGEQGGRPWVLERYLSNAGSPAAALRALLLSPSPKKAADLASDLGTTSDGVLRARVVKEVRAADRALEKALRAFHGRTEGAPEGVQGAGLEVWVVALQGVKRRSEVLRLLRERHRAQLELHLATHRLDRVREEMQAAAAGDHPSLNAPRNKSARELRDAIKNLREKCQTLRQHRNFIQHQADVAAGIASAITSPRPTTLPGAPSTSGAAPHSAPTANGTSGSGSGAAPTWQMPTAFNITGASPAVVGGSGGVPPEGAEVECVVCREPLEGELHVYTCGHCYHSECSEQIFSSSHLANQAECPLCRRRVKPGEVFRVAASAPGARGAEAGGGEPDEEEKRLPGLRALPVAGAWGTKIEALVRRLLWLKRNAPLEKSLVFSQFPEALRLVSKALVVNHVGSTQLTPATTKTGAALEAFLHNPDIRVLLLCLRTAAAGLTLVRANHVFLLEPSLDPAIEQQAVARVHRIGQEHPVHVTRLLLDETVEAEVLRVCDSKQALFGAAEEAEGDGEGVSLPAAAPLQEHIDDHQLLHLLSAALGG